MCGEEEDSTMHYLLDAVRHDCCGIISPLRLKVDDFAGNSLKEWCMIFVG